MSLITVNIRLALRSLEPQPDAHAADNVGHHHWRRRRADNGGARHRRARRWKTRSAPPGRT